MRDPAFAKTMTALIKAAALAAGQAASLKPWDEEIAGVPAFGYSFPEAGKFPDDPQKLRFNYQPTFGVFKDQYILASNKGLFRELVRLLDTEDRSKLMPQNMQMRLYAGGAAAIRVTSAADQSLAATIVGQGVQVGEARRQTEALFNYLQKLGTVGIETTYTASEFRFDAIGRPGSSTREGMSDGQHHRPPPGLGAVHARRGQPVGPQEGRPPVPPGRLRGHLGRTARRAQARAPTRSSTGCSRAASRRPAYDPDTEKFLSSAARKFNTAAGVGAGGSTACSTAGTRSARS